MDVSCNVGATVGMDGCGDQCPRVGGASLVAMVGCACKSLQFRPNWLALVTMNLRQIEIFRAVMSAGSITGAARLLHVSQPSVSRMVRHLELQLGVALFERRNGRLFATP